MSATTSIWEPDAERLPPALDGSLGCEVCVIGAGIAGLSVAYLAARQGYRVVVLDAAGQIGNGETLRTTAHLSNAIDDRYTELLRIHGLHETRLAAESHTAAIGRIADIAEEEGIPCDLQSLNGYLFNPPEGPKIDLDAELSAARQAGLRRVHRLEESPLRGFGPCLCFPDQAQINPLRYLVGLQRASRRYNCRFFGSTRVTGIVGEGPFSIVTAQGYRVAAEHLVIATNVPINDPFVTPLKQTPWRTYAIALRVRRGSLPPGLYWDTLPRGYHYVRLARSEREDEELLIVGGEDEPLGPTNDSPERFEKLERWARLHFPFAGEVQHRWAGQVMETLDGLAFIGRHHSELKQLYLATGDSGMGMTHGMLAGLILTDLISGTPNRWATLYDPNRQRAGRLLHLAKSAYHVATHYADYLRSGDVVSEQEIAPGEGAIIREGLHRLAVYRDVSGHCHQFSAICPHMKCQAHWNLLDKQWECPCHGSRFTPLGEVLSGPAEENLRPVPESVPADQSTGDATDRSSPFR